MIDSTDHRYGFFGWREFHNTRLAIVAEFERSKGYNQSRPVRTEHGVAGEAALRNWLSEFLPQRYGVTAGFIIPDVIGIDYQLYHFDVVIYDRLNAPVLWTDADFDRSERGKTRAIPAKYVHAVFESKASLTASGPRRGIQTHATQWPTRALAAKLLVRGNFFDFDPSLATNHNILPKLLPPLPIFGYWGGIVLHCSLDPNMAGLFELMPLPEKLEEAVSLDVPLARKLDELRINLNESGQVVVSERGAGVLAFGGPDNKWHFSKQYGPLIYGDNCGLHMAWSHNAFATFALDLLSRLEGVAPRRARQYMFGQVFDAIQPKVVGRGADMGEGVDGGESKSIGGHDL